MAKIQNKSGLSKRIQGSDDEVKYEEKIMETEDNGQKNEGKYELSDFLFYKENTPVIRKFFLFAILIIIAPAIFLILYKYFFILLLGMSKNNSLMFSLYIVIIYIFTLTLLYAYYAFKEDTSKMNNTKLYDKKKT
ncbi:conserved protein, unknown function [Hepatocystis sp. ex Piliocolobus tephrosceles]|nr:conserved protein, unknown function [Hepatocystis sp. ex Piliocolobus tephrosceles]